MELGEKLKQARLEAQLSQRQLCGEKITRNMLSQIENGSAHPSMDTLRYLAGQLGKPVSFFLEEDTVTSPNQEVIARAKQAWHAGDWAGVLESLTDYQETDPVFEEERQLLQRLASLSAAQNALHEGKQIYAGELLARLGRIETGYCAPELERRRLLLTAQADPRKIGKISAALPSLDGELLLRAKAALDAGNPLRCEQLLLAAEDQQDPQWNFVRGDALFVRKEYAAAATCYHRAEEVFPAQTAGRLERCYRELEDFKQAYFYACKQR